MGLQLIFVVETNKKCKSDWIYIKDTIDRFYQYDQAQVKFSPVYVTDLMSCHQTAHTNCHRIA